MLGYFSSKDVIRDTESVLRLDLGYMKGSLRVGDDEKSRVVERKPSSGGTSARKDGKTSFRVQNSVEEREQERTCRLEIEEILFATA